MSITAIVPAYNAEFSISKVVSSVCWYCDDVLVIDDGSTDLTSEVASRENCGVHRFEQNRGKADALRFGMKTAIHLGAEYIITLDADGEHDPTDIPFLLQPLKRRSADVVFGVREQTHGSGMATSKPTQSILRHHFSLNFKDAMCGFRAYTSSSAAKLISCSISKNFGIDFELALLTHFLKLSYEEVDISTAELQRVAGIRVSHLDAFCLNLKRFSALHNYKNLKVHAKWLQKIYNRDQFSVPIGQVSYKFSFDEKSGFFVRS